MSQKTCHVFAIVSLISAGVSLLLFGAMLDIVGLLFGILSFINIKKIQQSGQGGPAAQNTLKLAKIGIVVCVVAGLANMLTAAFLMPQMLAGTNVAGPTF